MRVDYRDFVGYGDLLFFGEEILVHSAKGSTWKEHKYIKRKNGTYYYPDSYEGGRHLPDGENSDEDDLEDWEEELYSDVEEILRKNPGLFDRTKLYSDDFQDFRLTLEEMAGVDTDKLSDSEIERMREKVKAYYDDRAAARDLSVEDVERLANEVIRGNFGSGQERRDLLGENYQQIQDRVNEILLGPTGSRKVSKSKKKEEPKETKKEESTEKKESKKDKVISGVNMERVLNVYRKKRGR